MQVSVAWLNEWLAEPVEAKDLAARLTMAGLEVDAVLPACAPFRGVVVGEIVACEKHPEADRLSVCQVSDGRSTVQVVCGAANASAGLKVPFATVGAELPGDVSIRKAKLRGVESFGMLCGASELGLEDPVDGLLVLPPNAPVGSDLRDYLQLDDTILELDLTPNRGDCLGMLGLAREVSALTGIPLKMPAMAPVVPAHDQVVPVSVQVPNACPRYAGRLICGIDARVPSPWWLRERLRRAGIRSIDAVVDVTNYVMLELGQPMHAFDRVRVQGGIVVRMAHANEPLALLDGTEKTLRDTTLVIADAKGPLAMAGIMGGEHSGVGPGTCDVVLESAFFDPIVLAGQAREYGLHTDSSHRFERGVDPAGQVRAIERATRLLVDIVGGQPGPVVDAGGEPAPRPVIALRRNTVRDVLGLSLPDGEVQGILERLGCDASVGPDGWTVALPSWRFDLARGIDLVEEVARVYGYDHLPVASPRYSMRLAPQAETRTSDDRFRDLLVDRGYQEAITYSFVDPVLQLPLCGEAAVQVRNPIASDMAAMRLSLWPGLLKAAAGNLQRQRTRVRLFETGLVFEGVAAGQQRRAIAGLACGPASPVSWAARSRPVDFYDIKADVEALLALAGCSGRASFERAGHPALHPGQSARIRVDGEPAGWVGALHPAHQRSLGLAGTPYLFELCLMKVGFGKLPSFKELSRFPEMGRDLALVLDRTVPAGDVANEIREQAGQWLKSLEIFDQFESAELGENKKSLGFSLVFQHSDRTLTDDEVNAVMGSIITGVTARFGALVRN